jgi:hypothetical protein
MHDAQARAEAPVAGALAVGCPLAAALVKRGAGHALDIGFYQDLQHVFRDATQKVAVVGLPSTRPMVSCRRSSGFLQLG